MSLSNKITKVGHEETGVSLCECGSKTKVQNRWIHPEKFILMQDVRESVRKIKEAIDADFPLSSIKLQERAFKIIDEEMGEKLI